MNGLIFISGGGGAKESFILDAEFVNSLLTLKLLYIPIGLKRDIIGYDDCYDWINRTLSVHSKRKLEIEMWINLNNKSYRDISLFGGIYIGGASNTYKFLDLLYRSNFIKIIKQFVQKGGLLYGGSSGAVILGKNIAITLDEKDGYKHENGLGLIGNYSILCHYDNTQDNRIKSYINQTKFNVLALPIDSGLVVRDKTAKIVGLSQVTMFDMKNINKFYPGEIFTID